MSLPPINHTETVYSKIDCRSQVDFFIVRHVKKVSLFHVAAYQLTTRRPYIRRMTVVRNLSFFTVRHEVHRLFRLCSLTGQPIYAN